MTMEDFDTKYMRFKQDKSYKGKTEVWTVWTRDGYRLATIKWFGRWRQYVFEPWRDTVFNQSCLTEITGFLKDLMDARK